ncbi:MAG: hypothetical protein PHQ75_06935 [Thermoguttaceae bacterium]|nr:hypothetical protein [Thermoguttaceae bacterium]
MYNRGRFYRFESRITGVRRAYGEMRAYGTRELAPGSTVPACTAGNFVFTLECDNTAFVFRAVGQGTIKAARRTVFPVA